MIKRADIVAEALTWVGTPWVHQASLKGVGTDCIGFVGGVALALGVPGAQEWRDTPEFHNYGRQPDPAVLLRGCDLLLDPVPKPLAQPGDILVMRFEAEPQHFGIVTKLNPMYMVHALYRARRSGKVVHNRVDSVWWGRVKRVYRFRGVE